MLRSMSNWIYDHDPFQPLKWQDDLDHFKARLARGEDVFGGWLLATSLSIGRVFGFMQAVGLRAAQGPAIQTWHLFLL